MVLAQTLRAIANLNGPTTIAPLSNALTTALLLTVVLANTRTANLLLASAAKVGKVQIAALVSVDVVVYAHTPFKSSLISLEYSIVRLLVDLKDGVCFMNSATDFVSRCLLTNIAFH